jgi:hypothetical protein
MERKQIEIDCPCCSSRILVDVRTGQILRTRRPAGTDEAGRKVVSQADWQDALGRVQERTAGGEDRLEQALDRERRRDLDLDDLFRQAKDKAGKNEEPED